MKNEKKSKIDIVRPMQSNSCFKLSSVELSIDMQLEFSKRFSDLTMAENIAYAAYFHLRVSKDLEHLFQKSCKTKNSGTADEDDVLDKEKFKLEKYEVSKEAKKLLMDNFYYFFEGFDDMYDFLKVDWDN